MVQFESHQFLLIIPDVFCALYAGSILAFVFVVLDEKICFRSKKTCSVTNLRLAKGSPAMQSTGSIVLLVLRILIRYCFQCNSKERDNVRFTRQDQTTPLLQSLEFTTSVPTSTKYFLAANIFRNSTPITIIALMMKGSS